MRKPYNLDRAMKAFWAKVDKTGDCWLWGAGKDGAGYGMFWFEGRTHRAHRLAWAWTTKCPIPPRNLPIDHICHNPPCVNPKHLRLVTQKQNCENRAGLQKNNKSGYQGVSWHSTKDRWSVRVKHNGVRYNFGYFDDVHEAGEAALQGRLKLHTHNDLDRK